ncbi:MAG: DUF4347 domain-containing protein, partial [Microcoleus sp. SU_5_3]|nr:DUF4347 domain-containing protein [Microcoleus sp. SU_5_3]
SLEDLCYETGNSFPGGTGEQARDLNVGLDLDGFTFIQRIAELTNANVAASKNLTGSAAKGGDWKLEARTGEIQTPLIFEPDVLATYNHVLAPNFSSATNFASGGTGSYTIAVGKLNSDNFPDIAVGNVGSNKNVAALLGTGTGSFGTANLLPNSSSEFPVSMAIGDFFNPDGFSDIAVASPGSGPPGSNSIAIWQGTSTGSFGTPTNISLSSLLSVAAADFNKDGRTDLAAGSGGQISILLATPTGSFATPTNISLGPGGGGDFIAVADFDGDGNLDLVTPKRSIDRVYFLKGDGAGNFALNNNFTAVGDDPRFLAVGDFNKDGKPDLVTANYNSSNVSVLLWNSTTNSFNPAVAFAVGTNPASVAVGDLDADGNLDIVTANYGSNNVSILSGDGTGNFGVATNFNVGTQPNGVAVGDFNADGFSDLATANGGSNDVSILLNIAVNFGAATYSGTEGTGDTFVNIPVTISGTPSSDVTVPIVINPSSTATQNSDYTFSPATVTFLAGTTTLTENVAVTIKSDNLSENAETAIFDFGTIAGGLAGTTKQTTLTIAANSQPSELSPYQIDLKTGNIIGQPNQFISLVNSPADSNSDSWLETVAKINFIGNIKKAKFIVEYDKTPTGWTVNLGDSASNDGYGGDTGNQSRDAETQILNGSMAVFGNDYNTPSGGELPQGNVPNFVSNGSRIELEVSNENLAWDNKTGLKNSLNSPYLYALNGQADDSGPVNSEIYAGFNRVISGPADRIGSGASKVTILLNPIDYAVSAGVATVTEGNSGQTGVVFTVTRSGCTEFASKIDYAIGGTATNGTDFNNIGGTSGATAATGTINFAAGETSKTITLDVLGDGAIEPNETLNVTLSNPSGLDATPTITAAVATTAIANDDVGITINPTGLTTTETGGKADFTVQLKSPPTADVTIGLSSDNPAEGTVSTNSLTFTPANWNQPQIVTVNGVDDLVADGNQNYSIVTAAASSTDPLYNNLNPDDVAVTNSDNETPGITVNPTAGLTTGEDGATANFTVVLNTQPAADVTVGLSSNNTAEGTVSTNSITFTPANWNIQQQLTVTGVNDSITDGD